MNHHTSPSFWAAFDQLPREVQQLARDNYELLHANPRHPSLHFKKVGGYWSVRVVRGYRALGTDAEDGVLWAWIGTHAEYKPTYLRVAAVELAVAADFGPPRHLE